MKKLILLLSLSPIIQVNAQQKGITEMGDEVILYENGTWEYQNKETIKDSVIPTNETKYVKDKKSTFLLKSKTFDVGFWINPKIWSFSKSKNNPEAEFELNLKDGDLYGMIITEQIQIPLENLKNIAFESAQSVAPDLKIVKEEYRNVNGKKVLLLEMNGTMQGIKFTYFGYYFSSQEGTVQYVTFTAQNLMKKYKSTSEKLLNGLVMLD